jgi:hypothetical protein
MTLILLSMVCREIYTNLPALFDEKGKSERCAVFGYRMEDIYK